MAASVKPTLVIFTMDGSIGQAAFDQAKAFKDSVEVRSAHCAAHPAAWAGKWRASKSSTCLAETSAPSKSCKQLHCCACNALRALQTQCRHQDPVCF